MMRTVRPGLLFLAVIAASCAERSTECGPTSSCAPLSDIEVTSVAIGPVTRTHPVTGLGVVDSLVVTFTVRNAGRVATLSTSALISVPYANGQDLFDETIPVLEPGQSVTRTIHVNTVRNFFDAESYPGDDRITANVHLILPDSLNDPPDNNSRDSEAYHFARPILDVVAAPLAEPRVRVNGPLRLSITITNLSAVAAAKNIQLRHCLNNHGQCWAGNWTTFGNVPLADLAPGESRTLNYTTSISPTGSDEGYLNYGLSICVTPRADTSAYMNFETYREEWACDGAGVLEVWPDYEACNPPVLGTQPATLSAPNCGHYPVPPDEPGSTFFQTRYRWKLYYVFALDVVAGKTYRVTGVPAAFVDHTGWAAPDQDPAPDRVSFPVSGRYYLRVYDWQGVKTVTVTEP